MKLKERISVLDRGCGEQFPSMVAAEVKALIVSYLGDGDAVKFTDGSIVHPRYLSFLCKRFRNSENFLINY